MFIVSERHWSLPLAPVLVILNSHFWRLPFSFTLESTTLFWTRFLRFRFGKKLSIICRHTILCGTHCRLHCRICCRWWKQVRVVEWKWANTSHFTKVLCQIVCLLIFHSLLLWVFKICWPRWLITWSYVKTVTLL